MVEINFSEANFRLDLAIAMLVGWQKSDDPRHLWIRPDDGIYTNLIPSYSEDTNHALEALRYIMDSKDIYRAILDVTTDGFICKVGDATAHADTAALAICKALYKL